MRKSGSKIQQQKKELSVSQIQQNIEVGRETVIKIQNQEDLKDSVKNIKASPQVNIDGVPLVDQDQKSTNDFNFGADFTFKHLKNNENESKNQESKDVESRYMSFGSKPLKPPVNFKVRENQIDIEDLLEYDGEDIDQLAMFNSKDALRVMDNIEDMLDARINQLMESDSCADEFGENFTGLTCY